LFIYQLEGRMDSRTAIEAGSFLGHWQEEDSAFLFFSAPGAEVVEDILSRQRHLRLVDSTRMPYAHWQGPVFSGESIGRFHFVAPWETAASADPNDAQASAILLDPGLVFGAGTHPTTRACLKALERAADEGAAATVLDLGTGSGILALAAAQLLEARVLAVDLNFLAARTAARNVRLNRMADRILVAQARAEDMIDCPADLVVANIHGEVLLRLMEAPGFRQKPRLILSGLLRSEAKEVRRRLALQGMGIAESWVQDGVWHTYYAVNPATLEPSTA
jgi:ribosomal protein L11 methyltransferase